MYMIDSETFEQLAELFSKLTGIYLDHAMKTNRINYYGRERVYTAGCDGGYSDSNGGYAEDRCGVRMAGVNEPDVLCMVPVGTEPKMAETVQIRPNVAETQEAQK